jgi:hypothetical protein
MPKLYIPCGFQALNAEGEESWRCFYVIFQCLTWHLLPTRRQKLPIAQRPQQDSATIGAIARHHRALIRDRERQWGNTTATRTYIDRGTSHAGYADDPFSAIANSGETASDPANFSESSV